MICHDVQHSIFFGNIDSSICTMIFNYCLRYLLIHLCSNGLWQGHLSIFNLIKFFNKWWFYSKLKDESAVILGPESIFYINKYYIVIMPYEIVCKCKTVALYHWHMSTLSMKKKRTRQAKIWLITKADMYVAIVRARCKPALKRWTRSLTR